MPVRSWSGSSRSKSTATTDPVQFSSEFLISPGALRRVSPPLRRIDGRRRGTAIRRSGCYIRPCFAPRNGRWLGSTIVLVSNTQFLCGRVRDQVRQNSCRTAIPER